MMLNPLEIELMLKVLLAAVLGFLIGIERKGGRRGAGSRTFSLICMGSALFTILSIKGFNTSAESARVAAQIVSGIGFIGAGIIWRSRDDAVHGLTTAAAVWCSAAIGISIGTNYFLLAFGTTILMMVILSKGHPIEEARKNLCITAPDASGHLEKIQNP